MNIDQIRSDISNYGDKIFLNSAGSSLTPKSSLKKIEEYLHQEESLGGYKVVELRANDIADFYVQAARLINAQPTNIAFTFGATDAYIKALSSIPFQKGDTIITTDDDYTSNQIQFIALTKRFRLSIVRIKNLENGDLDIEDFQRLVSTYHPKLVAVTHVPNNSGLVQNVEAIGEICHAHNILFLLDACQSVGQLKVDVKKIKCDFLTATGRKFLRGPRGTGFLYVSDKIRDGEYTPVIFDGGAATWTKPDHFELPQTVKRFEMWEVSYALVVGLAEALRYANEVGIANIQSYNQKLIRRLRNNLGDMDGVKLFDKGSKKCNILTFRKDLKTLEQIKSSLDENKVFFSVSKKEWGLIDFEKKGVDWAIRLSPHYFNTLDEMDSVADIIDRI